MVDYDPNCWTQNTEHKVHKQANYCNPNMYTTSNVLCPSRKKPTLWNMYVPINTGQHLLYESEYSVSNRYTEVDN